MRKMVNGRELQWAQLRKCKCLLVPLDKYEKIHFPIDFPDPIETQIFLLFNL